uniref:Uncharacterized protein n=1 Tax=Anguilla anguilla TaxID=7936 RepID=A0A0E9S0H7_ANGAN
MKKNTADSPSHLASPQNLALNLQNNMGLGYAWGLWSGLKCNRVKLKEQWDIQL